METAPDAVGEVPVEQGQEATQPEGTDQAQVTEESVDSFTSTDLAALPEELQTLAKQLQGDYTRKTQEISGIKGKASAFDDLVSNPGFTAMMENIEKYGTPLPPPPEPKVQEPELSGEELLLKMIEDPTFLRDMIRKEAEAIADQKVGPLTERDAQQMSTAEISRLSTLYPDFVDHADAISEAIESSGYTLNAESAYKLVTYDKVRTAGKEEGARITENRVKSADVSGASTQVVKPQLYKNMAEAFAAAKKQHGI